MSRKPSSGWVGELDAQGSAQDFRKRFDQTDYWMQMTAQCLSCGICTYVCPTCYCFSITDETQNLKGERLRSWDSCMFYHYTLEASGHNPRPTKLEAFRNRVGHKFSYIPERYEGLLGCCGCGRCIRSCPVSIDIRQVVGNLKENTSEDNNPYLPELATVQEVITETGNIRTLRVTLDNKEKMEQFTFRPGQVGQLSVFGTGESTFVINSPPTRKDYLQFSVMKAGEVTQRIHQLNAGDQIGLRAPLGNGFDFEDMKGHDILFVGGGIGMAPLRTLLLYMIDNRSRLWRHHGHLRRELAQGPVLHL